MSLDESNSEESVLPRVEPQPTPQTKPESKKEKPKSQTQQIKDLINKKFDEGFVVGNKHDKVDLQNTILDELKIKKGNSSDIGRQIIKIMEERRIKIPDKIGGKKMIGDVVVNLMSNNEEDTASQVQSNVPNNQNPHSALPKAEQNSQNPHGTMPKGFGSSQTQTEQSEQKPEQKFMSDDAQSKLIKKGLNDFIAPLYISLGIVEPDEEEKEDEAKLPTAKQFRKDMDTLGDDISDYLKENNIKLPALLNHLAIGLSLFMVLVLPVLKFKFFSSKQDVKPSYDDSADNIEVKVE